MYVHVAATQPARSQSIAEDKSWAENACINQYQTKKGASPLISHSWQRPRFNEDGGMYRYVSCSESVSSGGRVHMGTPDRCPTIYM